MAKLIIVNSSKLRVAVQKKAKKEDKSYTDYLIGKKLEPTLISKGERRFERNTYKLSFEQDEFTVYGAIYNDVWSNIVQALNLNPSDFELEVLEVSLTGQVINHVLAKRLDTVEDMIVRLVNEIEEIKKVIK